MKKIDQILVVGNYNAGNIGDDSLLYGSIQSLKEFLPEHTVKVVAPKKPYDYPLLPAGIKSFLRFNWFKTLYAMKKSRVVVFGGGGLLNPEEPKSIYIWGLQVYWAKFFKCKIAMLGQSFVASDSTSVKSILEKVDLLTVRDSVSYNYVNRLGLSCPIRKTADLSFINEIYKEQDDYDFDNEDFIVLNLRSYSELGPEVIEEVFSTLVNYISDNTAYSIYLMPFCKSDLALYKVLKSKFKDNGRLLTLPNDYQILVSAIKKSKAVIAQRLHAVLFTIQLKKKFIALSYSSKVSGLLTDLGLENQILSLYDKNLQAKLVNRIEKLLDGSSIEEAVDSSMQKKKAEDNFRLLKMYLDSK